MRRDVRILLVGDGERIVFENHSIRLYLNYRGCGEEHDCNVVDQGIICCACPYTVYPPCLQTVTLALGSAHCTRGHYPTGGNPRERYNVYRRFWRCVCGV